VSCGWKIHFDFHPDILIAYKSIRMTTASSLIKGKQILFKQAISAGIIDGEEKPFQMTRAAKLTETSRRSMNSCNGHGQE